MTLILAIETSGEACSCALSGPDGIQELHEVMPRLHARELLPMVDRLLNSVGVTLRELDAIACSRGPGSFTGLRICTGVVQGLAFAAELPVIPVSTLATLALQIKQCREGVPVFACLDARIGEIYSGFFDCSGALPCLLGEETLTRPELVAVPANCQHMELAAGGNGLQFNAEFPSHLQQQIRYRYPELHPRASAVAALALQQYDNGELLAPELLHPVYLRDQVAKKPGIKS